MHVCVCVCVCVCSLYRNTSLFNQLNFPHMHNFLHYRPISTTPHASCTKDFKFVCDRKIMKGNLGYIKKESFSAVFRLPLNWFFSNITSFILHTCTTNHVSLFAIIQQLRAIYFKKKLLFGRISDCERGTNFAVSMHAVELRNLVAIGRQLSALYMVKQLTFFFIYFHLGKIPEIYIKNHTDTLFNACVNNCDVSSFRKIHPMEAKEESKKYVCSPSKVPSFIARSQ